MVLKQRLSEGRTNYIDIGNEWQYVQKHAPEFKEMAADITGKDDCIGLICFNGNKEPIFKNFPNWIYSNDGHLFMNIR